MAGIAVLSLAYVLSQFYRSFLAILTPIISSELAISESQFSFASGAWFATFALAQFPVGIWLVKIGPRTTAALMHGVFAAGGMLLFSAAGAENGLVYQWAKKGTRARQPKDQRYASCYIFGAFCAARDVGAALVMPYADTKSMHKHLDEISKNVAPQPHGVILMDVGTSLVIGASRKTCLSSRPIRQNSTLSKISGKSALRRL